MDMDRLTRKLAEKWTIQWRKCEETNKKWESYNQNTITGLTNFKVGPPDDLDATTKGRWKADIIDVLRKCIRAYLIPNQEIKLRESWGKLKTCVLGNIRYRQDNEQNLVETNKSICRGINNVVSRGNKSQSRDNNKNSRKDQQHLSSIPPPPDRVVKNRVVPQKHRAINTKEEVVEELIGTLRRGESYTPLNIQYNILEEGGYTNDLARLLGWAIYGCKHRENFIRRNVVKYMDMYSEVEKEKFQQVKVRMKNNSIKVVKQYNTLRSLIHRQVAFLGRREISIIASLYQTQIIFFEVVSDNNKTSNVRSREQTAQKYDRVINILCIEKNKWCLLTATSEKEIRVQNTSNNMTNKLLNRDRKVVSEEQNTISRKNSTNNCYQGTIKVVGVHKEGSGKIGQLSTIQTQAPVLGERINNHHGTEGHKTETIERAKTGDKCKGVDSEKHKCIEDEEQKIVYDKERHKHKSIYKQIGLDIDGDKGIDSNRNSLESIILRDSISDIVNLETEFRIPQSINSKDRSNKRTDNEHRPIGIEREIEYRRIEKEGVIEGEHIGTDLTKNGEEDEIDSDNDSNSKTTISSIAALFIDKQLENGQITEELRRKKVTRRNVWRRWKNLVRGAYRRRTRSNRKAEKQQKIEIDSRKIVFDYTKNTLTEAEISLLGKGEIFCVVNYKVDEDRSKVDIYKYQRRLRLHELFRDPLVAEQEVVSTPSRRRSSILTPTRVRNSVRSNNRSTPNSTQITSNNRVSKDGNDERGRRLPSIYDPDSTNRNLNRYNTCIQEEIILTIQNKTIPYRDNISKVERTALKTLKQKIDKKEIIITKADKGSGLVAVDYETYITKGTKYIEQEAEAYTKIDEDEQTIVTKLGKTRHKLVEQLKDNLVIPPQTALYIKKQLEEKITGIKFYYKIHKDTNIHTMPVRPLQSCINAPTHHLSIVLTDILQPLLKTENIPTFIFDSNQLLFILHQLGEIPRDCTIISSDVSALYLSIPHKEGFRAMNTFLKDTTQFSEVQITSIMKALELVITENYIRWNQKIYKQTSGVAMGTPVAVAYANIFMHWVDKEIRQRATYIHEHIRYIDDNLFILPAQKIEDLIRIANNILPPHIKFTYETLDRESDKGLPFLDTQLTIAQNCTIQSRLYTKVTDRHAYFLPTSYHPPHITHNIPAAVFGRIKKICSREDWYREDTHKATTWLLDRGYKKADILRALHKINSRNRWEMIKDIEKNRSKKITTIEERNFQILLVREAWWINHLQTLEPAGLNVKLDCNQIYAEKNRQMKTSRIKHPEK